MNEDNIFKGKCYLCGKTKFIVRVDAWSSQNGVRGSWRNFCNACCKEMDWTPNREPNTCLKCGAKFIGSKAKEYCDGCLEEYEDE